MDIHGFVEKQLEKAKAGMKDAEQKVGGELLFYYSGQVEAYRQVLSELKKKPEATSYLKSGCYRYCHE